MYQAAYPDRFMEESNVGGEGNVFLEDGTWIDADTPLMPFRKRSGGFWTTRDSWDHTRFGYTYPELQRWRYTSNEEYSRAAISAISKLYGGSSRDQIAAQEATADGEPFMLTSTRKFTEWTIEIKASAIDLPPTFVVRFYLAGESPSDYPIDAGRWLVLMPMNHRKKVSQRATGVEKTLKGTLSLTAHLLDQIEVKRLKSLYPEDVAPYLKDKLTWKVHSVRWLQSDWHCYNLLTGIGQWRNPSDI